jgi:hypothetical protein
MYIDIISIATTLPYQSFLCPSRLLSIWPQISRNHDRDLNTFEMEFDFSGDGIKSSGEIRSVPYVMASIAADVQPPDGGIGSSKFKLFTSHTTSGTPT